MMRQERMEQEAREQELDASFKARALPYCCFPVIGLHLCGNFMTELQ
jgi:hypothetical protein